MLNINEGLKRAAYNVGPSKCADKSTMRKN